jgi:hypothetical protein
MTCDSSEPLVPLATPDARARPLRTDSARTEMRFRPAAHTGQGIRRGIGRVPVTRGS